MLNTSFQMRKVLQSSSAPWSVLFRAKDVQKQPLSAGFTSFLPYLQKDVALSPVFVISNVGASYLKSLVALVGVALVSGYSLSEGNNTKKSSKKYPFYTSADVAKRNGLGTDSIGKQSWVTYGHGVYDITEFIQSHPGGASKIKLAAGGSVEPFWKLFPFHYDLQLVQDILKDLKIGNLDPHDVEKVRKETEANQVQDAFSTDPIRHPGLKLHSKKPCNAEVPDALLTESYITPSDLFFIRHHHPVPMVNDLASYRLEIDTSEIGGGQDVSVTMEELLQLPQHEIIATIQCSGNRRSDMNQVKKTSGSPWVQGAISTAKWRGPKLVDVLKYVQVKQGIANPPTDNIEHAIFSSLDGLQASIPKYKALNEQGDVILATRMNDELITPEHGYPLRVIVPGHVGIRNVKWLKSIKLSKNEAEGDWQRGLNYKILPPGIQNATGIDISKIPAMQESSVFSAISNIENNDGFVDCKGWAFAGGGRGIARIDISTDEGQTWHVANVTEGGNQPKGHEWAWVFWEVSDIPAKPMPKDASSIQVISRAVDTAYNYQPEDAKHIWNMRGLGNNSWYRRTVPAAP